MANQFATSLLSRNNMSASELKVMANSNIEFVNNPKRPGSLFFTCGSTITAGYISPKVQEKFKQGSLKLDDMMYAECSKDGQTWVPCLMLKAANNVAGTF